MMAFLERSSPALKQILLNLYSAKKAMEIDHHLHEFGSVEYHIQCSASSEEKETYLSISTPLLSQGIFLSYDLVQHYTDVILKGIYFSDFMHVVEPPEQGYHITLRLFLSRIPRRKDSLKIITEIASVQAIILSFQLKEMLKNLTSEGGICKPIKLVYHPAEPFFVVKQLAKITAIFPMRFKEKTDVIIATAFFQELTDVGNSKAFNKAPHCNWSPIPPPELRGEPIRDLSTNGGFVSFEILPRHVEGKRLDKIVWNLLNFYAFVKYHVKCTKGFIQRRMRKRLDCLVEVLPNEIVDQDQDVEKDHKVYKRRTKLVNFSRTKTPRQRCDFGNKIKKIGSGIKIYKFTRFRRRWLKIPKCYTATSYTKLD